MKLNENLSRQIKHYQCEKCPYANDAGTCFGFCWQEILQEQRLRRGFLKRSRIGKEQYEQAGTRYDKTDRST